MPEKNNNPRNCAGIWYNMHFHHILFTLNNIKPSAFHLSPIITSLHVGLHSQIFFTPPPPLQYLIEAFFPFLFLYFLFQSCDDLS